MSAGETQAQVLGIVVTARLSAAWCHRVRQVELVLRRIGHDLRSLGECTSQWIPRADLDSIRFGNETHDAEPVCTVIREQLVDGVVVVAERCLAHGLRPTLVATANHEDIGMDPKALLPHLLRGVAAFAMTLFPSHSTFGRVKIVAWVCRPVLWPQSHVRGDDGSAV